RDHHHRHGDSVHRPRREDRHAAAAGRVLRLGGGHGTYLLRADAAGEADLHPPLRALAVARACSARLLAGLDVPPCPQRLIVEEEGWGEGASASAVLPVSKRFRTPAGA